MAVVDIIVLTWDALEYTKECVSTLFARTDTEFNLIVVDQGSQDDTKRYLSDFEVIQPRRVKVIYNEENTGFAGGNNQGIKISTAPYVLLLNNDIVIPEGDPEWLDKMLEFLKKNPDVGILGPRSNCAAGAQQKCKAEDEPFYVESLSGFCMLIPREVLQKVGLLDERFEYGLMEDRDYGKRVRLCEYKLAVYPQSFVFHHGSRTFKEHDISTRGEVAEQNQKRYKEKWRTNWGDVVREGQKTGQQICRPRMLFFSHVDLASQDDWTARHNDPMRTNGLAQGFVDHGWDVDLLTIEREALIDDITVNRHFHRRHVCNMKASDYDVVFFFPNLAVVSLMEFLKPLEERWRFKHLDLPNQQEYQIIHDEFPNIYTRLDVPRDSYKDRGWYICDWVNERSKVVGIYTHYGLELWKERYPGCNAFLNCNASVQSPPTFDENPFAEDNRRTVLWVGRLPPFHFKDWDELAAKMPDLHFCAVSGKLHDHDNGYHDPRETTPSTFEEKLAKAQGIFNSPNITLPGGLSYFHTFQYMQYCDVALGLAVRKKQDASSGKVWEYLCAGAPVAMDHEVPEKWLATEDNPADVDLGGIFRYKDWNDAEKVIREILERRPDHEVIKGFIQGSHTWYSRASNWDQYIRQTME